MKTKFNAEDFGLILEFSIYWQEHYRHIDSDLTDSQVLSFMKSNKTVASACSQAADYLLANGAYAQE